MTGDCCPIVFRPCQGLDELGACVRLQQEVWGLNDAETMPRRVFVVSHTIGGQVMGAFDPSLTGPGGKPADALIGFAMALPGLRQGQPYLHSHMLAVRNKYRNQGIGRRLKLLQREDALARGIRRMEWTFDPLEIKNSFLNLVRLGAIVRRYYPNFYGVSSSSPTGGIPTDRLCAEWWMESSRVKSALRGQPIALPPIEQTIELPREIAQWRQTQENRNRVFQIQQENRRRFQEAFANGLAIVGFQRNTGEYGIFQLGRWEEEALSTSNPSQPYTAGIHED